MYGGVNLQGSEVIRLDIQMKSKSMERRASVMGHVEMNMSNNFYASFLSKR